ncbi:zinc finger protein [Penaeus vannamei]|uniref:Zinc finger protein n=1 Tax=Penaeus vannamei TaxID=6689 RepID=A0A3R7P9Y6_PENVA|nr:zinc finger protein [Penaeus vannamei]
MSTVGEWNESLDNLDDLISCMGSLEREDIIYLDEYLVGETSPHSHSPSRWLALMKGESEEDQCEEVYCGERYDVESGTEGHEYSVFEEEDNADLIINLPQEQSAAQTKPSDLGKRSGTPSRSTKGVPKVKFVSYESLPASKAKLFLCELCGMKLSTREARRRHILAKHIKERKNFCKICGKAFIFKFALKAHKAVHSDNPRFNCVCGISFSVRASYMDHIKRIHRAASEMKYPCELCFKSFGDRQTLRIHLISVHKPKTISCTQKGCNKVFSTVGLMRNHYRYHLNRKFTCDECGRSFSTESYMYKHRLTHSGIRPHVCVDCGKTYLSASHLSKHRRMAHSTARPFQCSFCGKCYKTKDQVNYHESSHKGEKPFQCEVCGYATSYRNTYYAHRKKHFVKSSPDSTASNVQKSSMTVQRRESNEDDITLQAYDNVSIHITTHTEREGDEMITLATSDASLKTSGELNSVGELEAEIGDQTISLITLPEKYERVEIDTEDSLPHHSELGVELLKGQSIAHIEQPDANQPVKLSSSEVCPVEDFSTMIELDSGVASLSGHIVDDSLSLAQLEVVCPLCDEQFMCMDAYVTHLECSHN